MKKLVIFLILLLGISCFTFFFICSNPKEDLNNNEVEGNNVKEKIKTSDSLEYNENFENKEESEIVSEEQMMTTENDSFSNKHESVNKTIPEVENKKETPKTEEQIPKNNNIKKDTNDSIIQSTEENNNFINKENDSKLEVENEAEEKEEENKIDLEYENLLKQVEYANYDECLDVGFKKALEDTVNILGFSCPYIAYKGEIIGYRLQLDYTNPMKN